MRKYGFVHSQRAYARWLRVCVWAGVVVYMLFVDIDAMLTLFGPFSARPTIGWV